MQDELMSNAVQLMALGMGTVVLFLALLVVAMNVMSSALKGFADPPKVSTPSSSGSAAPVDPEVRHVIALAIKKYRREHGE